MKKFLVFVMIMTLCFSLVSCGNKVTSALVYDDDWNYTVVYLLDSVDVYEDDDVTIYGIPAANCAFENISGGTTNCVAIIGSSIKG